MPIPSQARQAGQAAQAAAQQQQATPEFRPIILHSGQSFPGPGDTVTQSGVIFSGNTAYLDDLDNLMSCRGGYCVRNTLHDGIAGLMPDGRLVFGVNSRIDGRYTTMMGAFDKAGQPSPPTAKEQKLLGNLLHNSENRIVLATKTRNDIGFKTEGTNPRGGVYVANGTITFDLGYEHKFNDNTSLGGEASATMDWEGRQVLSRSASLYGKTGDLSFRAGLERAGQTLTQTAELRKGRYFANAKVSSDGTSRNREYNIGADITKSTTLTVNLRPDYRPPSTAPAQPYRFDPANPTPLPDHSNAKITLSIKF
ncbi:hypothetical protein [Neorhizobium alkalisoli]|jgi:hypothetical protein|uniref:Uncharacterized protein n=1 Tax=Neorhizobium alkalisoli TaxID=528178 RepID=A0A561QNP7_9HYPH|nr:hypothetical protein [Neorhizobium alkalisoli]TWF52021.1 hypothetical protein FHW37_105120 [Neorhizobium alkalisoli]